MTKYLKVMFIPTIGKCYLDLSSIMNYKNIIIIFIAILFAGLGQLILSKLKCKDKIKVFYEKYIEIFVIIILMFTSIMMLASSTYNPFIYFRF